MKEIIYELNGTIYERKENYDEKSYTCYLFKEGIDKILKKIGEESAEVIIAAKNGNAENVTAEVADLAYHLLVMLAELNIPVETVRSELEIRAGKRQNLKEMKQTDKNT